VPCILHVVHVTVHQNEVLKRNNRRSSNYHWCENLTIIYLTPLMVAACFACEQNSSVLTQSSLLVVEPLRQAVDVQVVHSLIFLLAWFRLSGAPRRVLMRCMTSVFVVLSVSCHNSHKSLFVSFSLFQIKVNYEETMVLLSCRQSTQSWWNSSSNHSFLGKSMSLLSNR